MYLYVDQFELKVLQSKLDNMASAYVTIQLEIYIHTYYVAMILCG